ncbi:aminotransferase class I/II-fold pyridoxal phosphate-dependent enzyme [Mucilaginibacter ginkgonis]|uniref:Aminotransferase class I/II-fold pyridoxal phosphate-dependent enzyme n=1 Tax=Mucilaginibacter ginkgonis TaxID=2682091 RepID=A0A6I4HV73_9SPHI|nr:aminotransferase class I/II-fold pyridoxal phosphate-dependent enzyme [Mucilaginibacter ginkgonis]QQL49910.1 aminotransferase class I/II-fold pyridoxal phosphate-dependent enzyme [Mucilaginibacter ginkgonis]
MHPADINILNRLNERNVAGNLRALNLVAHNRVDFTSNDYLGFSKSEALQNKIASEMVRINTSNGATGSRLLTGNSAYAEALEQSIAQYHGYHSALHFNSGYDANIGLFSALPQRGDTVIADEFIHASIIDGIRLSNANRYSFKHNDLASLTDKLRAAKGNIYVVVESVYSMDGDTPDLISILKLCKEYHANLIVDEAHAIGVFKKGIINELNLQDDVFACVITYGKAMGVHGAAILGSKLLVDYLVNFARSFIYTTAAPLHQLASIKCAYEMLTGAISERKQLHANIAYFNSCFGDDQLVTRSVSAIQGIRAGSNPDAKAMSNLLLASGIDARPILSPTVAVGGERLRVCLHSYNTYKEIKLLADCLNDLKQL